MGAWPGAPAQPSAVHSTDLAEVYLNEGRTRHRLTFREEKRRKPVAVIRARRGSQHGVSLVPPHWGMEEEEGDAERALRLKELLVRILQAAEYQQCSFGIHSQLMENGEAFPLSASQKHLALCLATGYWIST